jgi:hypothetical protein
MKLQQHYTKYSSVNATINIVSSTINFVDTQTTHANLVAL